MSYANKTLTCRDCGAEFVFTAGEQEFYARKGFTNEPTRCANCRAARKGGGGGGGGGYGDSYGGGGGYGGGRSSGGYGGGRATGERQMTTVTCAGCNKETQVPFVPRGDKPVYCDDCFRQRRASSSRW